MARLTNDMMGGKAYAENKTRPMVDLSQKESGQQGFRPDLRGYASNSAHVKRNLIAVLVEAPTGFQDLPGSDRWVATLKSLIELHSKTIEGLTSTLTAEFVENPVGGAGEMQEDISNVTRARSTPTHVWTEKYGKPINAFLEGWITSLIMDPATKVPNVVTQAGVDVEDLLPDYTGCTVLYFEPDPTMTKITRAWLCTNMMPKTAGEVTGSRDLTTGGESLDYNVEFTALTQEGFGVNKMAQEYLDNLNRTGVNPNYQPSFVEQISPVVDTDSGYADQMEDAGNTSL